MTNLIEMDKIIDTCVERDIAIQFARYTDDNARRDCHYWKGVRKHTTGFRRPSV